jgi:predicted SAM-dependent methyltransferase
MNIEFGCGDNPRNGYVGCDIRNLTNVKYVCNAWEITDFIEDNMVDRIYSRHFFEHLTFDQGRKTIDSWSKILKPNGECELILPDMDFHARQWLKFQDNKEQMEHAHASIWGWQRDSTSDWDIHKSGYNFNTLKKLLTEYGFHTITRLHELGAWHLHVTSISS